MNFFGYVIDLYYVLVYFIFFRLSFETLVEISLEKKDELIIDKI